MKLTRTLGFLLSILLVTNLAWASCLPSATVTEHYVDASGAPQLQVLSEITKPVITKGTYADYHNNYTQDCPGHQMAGTGIEPGDPNSVKFDCMDWEVADDLTIISAAPLGPIDDAHINATVKMASQWSTAPPMMFIIPSINPAPLDYPPPVGKSPSWKIISSGMDGTCYKTVIGNAGSGIGDVIEANGQYTLQPSLCEPYNKACQHFGRAEQEHWLIVVMDADGVQSNIQSSGLIGSENRGTCGEMGMDYDAISTSHNSTCPGNQNPN